MGPTWVDYDGAARLLGVSPYTVISYCRRGQLASRVQRYRFGRFTRAKRMISVASIAEFIAQRAVPRRHGKTQG